MDDVFISSLCDMIRGHEAEVRNGLAEITASLCEVKKELMLGDCNVLKVSQSRWLYWYAMRYMTGETYEGIARSTERMYGKRFSAQGVAMGITKMSRMIDTEAVWKRRWIVIRQAIRKDNDDCQGTDKEHVITVEVPKSLRGKIRIEIKEK